MLEELALVLVEEEEGFLLWTREEKKLFMVESGRRLRWNVQAGSSPLNSKCSRRWNVLSQSSISALDQRDSAEVQPCQTPFVLH